MAAGDCLRAFLGAGMVGGDCWGGVSEVGGGAGWLPGVVPEVGNGVGELPGGFPEVGDGAGRLTGVIPEVGNGGRKLPRRIPDVGNSVRERVVIHFDNNRLPLECGGMTPLWRARDERVGQSLARRTVCPPKGPSRAGSCPRTPEAPLARPRGE